MGNFLLSRNFRREGGGGGRGRFIQIFSTVFLCNCLGDFVVYSLYFTSYHYYLSVNNGSLGQCVIMGVLEDLVDLQPLPSLAYTLVINRLIEALSFPAQRNIYGPFY